MTQIGGFIKALLLMGSAVGYLTSKNFYFINFLQTKTLEDTNNDEDENKSKTSVNNLNQKSKFNEYLKD